MRLTCDTNDQTYGSLPETLEGVLLRQEGPGGGVCSLLRLHGLSVIPPCSDDQFIGLMLAAARRLQTEGCQMWDGTVSKRFRYPVAIQSAVLAVAVGEQTVALRVFRKLGWHEFLIPHYEKYFHSISYFMTPAADFAKQINLEPYLP